MMDGDRRLTNVLHLMELLHQAALTDDLGPVRAGALARSTADPSTPVARRTP